MTRVSVVIPAKDEADTLPDVLRDLQATMPALRAAGADVEVIVVDDHSVDATRQIALDYGARVVPNTRRPGKGHALTTGFSAATGAIIAMMDADYSHRPEDLPLFLEPLRNPRVGLVIGSRVFGGSDEYNHVRGLGNVFLSASVGLATKRYLSDALNGYKVFRRDVFTSFTYTSRDFEIEIELLANTLRRGYMIKEISSHERSRAGGQMKSRVVRHGTRFLARIIWEGLRGVRPVERPDLDDAPEPGRAAESPRRNPTTV